MEKKMSRNQNTDNRVIVKVWIVESDDKNRITMQIPHLGIDTGADKKDSFTTLMESPPIFDTVVLKNLCIPDITQAREQIMCSEEYKTMRDVDYVRKLLKRGGILESDFNYISKRCMILSSAFLIIFGMISLKKIDILGGYSPYLLLFPISPLGRGYYSRFDNMIKNINCCRQFTIQTYYNKVLLAAREQESKNMGNLLTVARHHNNGAQLFLVIALFVAGALLLALPDAFVLGSKSFILGIIFMGLGAVKLVAIIRNQCKTTDASSEISDDEEIKQDRPKYLDQICNFLVCRKKRKQNHELELPLVEDEFLSFDVNSV
jgi:hypothetical protein